MADMRYDTIAAKEGWTALLTVNILLTSVRLHSTRACVYTGRTYVYSKFLAVKS